MLLNTKNIDLNQKSNSPYLNYVKNKTPIAHTLLSALSFNKPIEEIIKLLLNDKRTDKIDFDIIQQAFITKNNSPNKNISKILIGSDKLDLNSTNNTQYNLLMLAVEKKRIDIVEMLIKKGIDIEYKHPSSNFGYTALMIALIDDAEDIAKLLIEKGANKNIKKRTTKQTPYDCAKTEEMKSLLKP